MPHGHDPPPCHTTAAFSDRPIGYKTFKPIVQAMETAGLIDVSLGRNSQATDFGFGQQPAYTPGYATRFRPTATMAAMALALILSSKNLMSLRN